MATLNQAARKQRKGARKKGGGLDILGGKPLRRAVVVRVFKRSPKKPNSANRRVAFVRIRDIRAKTWATAHVPGEGARLHEHSLVLLRGGRVKDLPGVRHRLVRGALDRLGLGGRKSSRSKYGTRRADV